MSHAKYPPRVYTTAEFIDSNDEILQGVMRLENDENTTKTNLLERRNLIRFDDKSFFSTLLSFTSFWNYKPNNEYISQRTTILSTKDEIISKVIVLIDL